MGTRQAATSLPGSCNRIIHFPPDGASPPSLLGFAAAAPFVSRLSAALSATGRFDVEGNAPLRSSTMARPSEVEP